MDKYIRIAEKIYKEKYSNSAFLILAGSIVRGEGTKTSDLDIVVIYDKLDFAYRESFPAASSMMKQHSFILHQ